MKKSNRIILALSFLLAAMGFLIPFWPLEILALIVATFGGYPLFALAVGVLLDLAYGIPTGPLQYVFFPFTLFALITIGARLLSRRYMFGRQPPEHI